MTRRGGIARYVCIEDGCSETYSLHYVNQADSREIYRRYNGKWRCARHTRPSEVLGPDNLSTVKEVTAGVSESPGLDKLFWDGGHGFMFGPGFKAWANDFPAGTKLIVTAQIVLPDPETR